MPVTDVPTQTVSDVLTVPELSIETGVLIDRLREAFRVDPVLRTYLRRIGMARVVTRLDLPRVVARLDELKIHRHRAPAAG